MTDLPCIRIGHLCSFEHLIIGIADLHLKNQIARLKSATLVPVTMNTWPQVCENLISRKIDGAFISAPLAMKLFASGLDIRMLMYTHRSGSVIMKSRAAGIKTISEFKGKTVLIPSDLSIQNMLLHRLLSSAGLSCRPFGDEAGDVTWEAVPPYLMAEMIMEDTDEDIAGFAVEEPFGVVAEKIGGAARLCTTGGLWKHHPGSVFVLRTDIMENHADAVQEITALFIKTARYIEENKTNELFFLAQIFSGQDKDTVQRILLHTDLTYDPSLLIPDPEPLNMIQNYLSGPMGIPDISVDLNRLINRAFIFQTR